MIHSHSHLNAALDVVVRFDVVVHVLLSSVVYFDASCFFSLHHHRHGRNPVGA